MMEFNQFVQWIVVGALVAFFLINVAALIIQAVQSGKKDTLLVDLVDKVTVLAETAIKNETVMKAIDGLRDSVPKELWQGGLMIGDTLKMFTPDNVDRMIAALQALAKPPIEVTPEIKPAPPGLEG